MDKSILSKISKRPVSSNQLNSTLTHRPSSLSEEDYWLAPKEARSNNCTSTSLTKAESLLDTIAELEAAQIERKTWFDNLFSPAGVSSILLILLTNVVASSLLFFNNKSEPNATVTNAQKVGLTRSGIPNGPNLAQQEFVELDLMTVSMLVKPTTKSDRAPRSNNHAFSPTKVRAKQKQVRNSSITSAILPELNSAPVQGYAIPSTALTNTNYYYILTEYNGTHSLQKAKQKFGNVSLVKFPQGLFIYMGAFYDSGDANRFVERLAQQGIMAYTYHPE
jgi:hypothetical protein